MENQFDFSRLTIGHLETLLRAKHFGDQLGVLNALYTGDDFYALPATEMDAITEAFHQGLDRWVATHVQRRKTPKPDDQSLRRLLRPLEGEE